MGAPQSKPVGTAEQANETPKINHERFSNRVFLRGEDNEENILIEVPVPSENQYKFWKEQLDKISNKEAILVPKSHTFKKEGYCGSTGNVEIIYQNYPFLLSDQIHNRECLNTKYFEQNQLWYLVLTLLAASDQFHTKGKKIGDVRPENVFISEDGSVKVACVYSWPLERTNYEKTFDKEITYLAPEELFQLGYGRIEPISNFQLAETFSIGLTILDAATLSDSKDLYKNKKNIDYSGLQARIRQLQEKQYSKALKMLIKNMCDVNNQNRTKAVDLYQWLYPYEQAINNFQQFQPQIYPPKFSQSQAPSQIKATTNFKTYVGSNDFNGNYGNYTPLINPVQTGTSFITQTAYSSDTYPKLFIGNTVNTGLPIYQGIPFNPTLNSLPATYVSSVPTSVLPNPSEQIGGQNIQFSKFSLQKIDQQLQKSRKQFPS